MECFKCMRSNKNITELASGIRELGVEVSDGVVNGAFNTALGVATVMEMAPAMDAPHVLAWAPAWAVATASLTAWAWALD